LESKRDCKDELVVSFFPRFYKFLCSFVFYKWCSTISGEVKILHAWTNAVLYQGKLELTEEGGVSRNSYGEEEFEGDNKLEVYFDFEDFFKSFEEGLRIFNDTDLYNAWSAKNG
jgi:hypothetical protein